MESGINKMNVTAYTVHDSGNKSQEGQQRPNALAFTPNNGEESSQMFMLLHYVTSSLCISDYEKGYMYIKNK